uniref:CSON011311 protein n=1 Tax=Culicoides sonorensis TaxID=179676 RepID=A0A336K0Z2_CULSO
MDFVKEETQQHFFGFSSSFFKNEYNTFVGAKVDSLIEESLKVISESNEQKVECEKSNINHAIEDQLVSFKMAMSVTFDKYTDIPNCVPLVDYTAFSNISEEEFHHTQTKLNNSIETFLKAKYFLEALKFENEVYKKVKEPLLKEESLYPNIITIGNDVLTITDLETINKEL